jgi:hypothetical protein
MGKQKKKVVVEEPVEVDGIRQDMAVSIMPQIKNGRTVFEIVRFNFTAAGECTPPEVIHTTINEATAITLLFQTAHENLGVKELRAKVKVLKGRDK